MKTAEAQIKGLQEQVGDLQRSKFADAVVWNDGFQVINDQVS